MRGMRSRMEVLKGKEEEFELSLELSLGRSYEKLDKSNPFEGQKNYGFSRFDKFESCKEDLGDENVCLTSDEGYKRLTGNKLVLGAHQFQAGVLDMNLSPWGHKNVLQAEARCKKIVVSDYQRGGTNDTGSNSSSLSSLQNLGASRKSGAFEGNDSSSPTQIEPSTENSKQYALSDQTNNNCSTSGNPPTSKGTSSSGLIEPPKQRPELALFAHMPCVSTTGNGPNGRTINGFLYKYTKLEVSIVCVCHGNLFSPAEFVEHAGGVDILYPMKHITVVPSLSG